MAIVSLPMAPRRALTGHATLRRPAQQGLRRDPGEDCGFAGPIPLARGRTWHSKTQAPPDPQEPVAELGGQARPNHRPRASIRKRLELGHNASVSAQEYCRQARRPRSGAGERSRGTHRVYRLATEGLLCPPERVAPSCSWDSRYGSDLGQAWPGLGHHGCHVPAGVSRPLRGAGDSMRCRGPGTFRARARRYSAARGGRGGEASARDSPRRPGRKDAIATPSFFSALTGGFRGKVSGINDGGARL
jgi:hypothetical protein